MATKEINEKNYPPVWIRFTSLKFLPKETKVILSLRSIQEVQELPDGKGCIVKTDGNNEHRVSESMDTVSKRMQMAIANIRHNRP